MGVIGRLSLAFWIAATGTVVLYAFFVFLARVPPEQVAGVAADEESDRPQGNAATPASVGGSDPQALPGSRGHWGQLRAGRMPGGERVVRLK